MRFAELRPWMASFVRIIGTSSDYVSARCDESEDRSRASWEVPPARRHVTDRSASKG
jgi:hypothetical protein